MQPLALLCVLCLLTGCVASQTRQDAPGRVQALGAVLGVTPTPPEVPPPLQASDAAPGQGWTEGLVMGVREGDTGLTVIFLNTHSQPDGLAPGVWHTLDVAALGVPQDAVAVFLSGLLIISHGWSPETCSLTMAFRAPGSQDLAGNYIFQTIEAAIFGGQRSNAAAWLPVKNGKFEMHWTQSSPRDKAWPETCAYGVNLRASAYVRKGVTVRLEPVS